MSTEQIRNVNYLVVGSSLADQTVTAGGPISALAEGEVGVFSLAGTRLIVGDTNTQFTIAVGGASSKPFFISDVITVANVKSIVAKAGAAPVEQQDAIGFDGAANSGSITLTNSNLYMVAVYVQEYLTSSTDGRTIKHFQYNSDALATEEEVADGLLKSAIHNFQKEAEDYVGFEMMMATTNDVAVGTGVLLVTFTNGSKTISCTGAIDDGTGSAAFVVGDYIRLGSAATDEVYKIMSLDTTAETAVLNVPFQGATQIIDDALLRRINVLSAACGILMTGKPLSNVIGKEFYKKARWELSLTNFSTTTVARKANADKGSGSYEEMSQQEHFMEGFKGEYHRMGEPGIYPAARKTTLLDDAGVRTYYDLTTITWEDTNVVGFTGNVSPKALIIASPETGTDNPGTEMATTSYMDNAAEGVWEVLESLTGLSIPSV